MSALTIRLSADASALSAALAELSEFPERLHEVVELPFDRELGLTEFARVDRDVRIAGGADECRVLLQPSERLLDLLAAFRARDVD